MQYHIFLLPTLMLAMAASVVGDHGFPDFTDDYFEHGDITYDTNTEGLLNLVRSLYPLIGSVSEYFVALLDKDAIGTRKICRVIASTYVGDVNTDWLHVCDSLKTNDFHDIIKAVRTFAVRHPDEFHHFVMLLKEPFINKSEPSR